MSEESETPPEVRRKEGGADMGNKPSRKTRRGFLGDLARLATLVTVPAMLPSSEPVRQPQSSPPDVTKPDVIQPPEIEQPPSALVLDMFGIDKFTNKTLQEHFKGRGFSDEGMLKKMGVVDDTTLKGLREAVPQNEDESAMSLLKALELYYGSHGENVEQVRQRAAGYFGNLPKDVHKSSMVDAVRFKRIDYDELGNPTLRLTIDPQRVGEIVEQSEDTVVNMSFETGDVGFKYELFEKVLKHPGSKLPQSKNIPVRDAQGNIISTSITYTDADGNEISEEEYTALLAKADETEIRLREPKDRVFQPQDGYIGENTYANLSHMAELALKNPNKIFVAAGGNPNRIAHDSLPDIREARKRLKTAGKWPENLFMVGVWWQEAGADGAAALGDDFYVRQDDLREKFGAAGAASYATPTLTAAINKIQSEGIHTPAKIRDTLQNCVTIKNGGEFFILDFDKIKDPTIRAVG